MERSDWLIQSWGGGQKQKIYCGVIFLLFTYGNVLGSYWPSSLINIYPVYVFSSSSESNESTSLMPIWKISSSRLTIRWRQQWTHRQWCLLARPYSEYMLCNIQAILMRALQHHIRIVVLSTFLGNLSFSGTPRMWNKRWMCISLGQ